MMKFIPNPKKGLKPKKKPTPIKRSRKPIQRKSKFKAQDNETKSYKAKRTPEEIATYAESCRSLRFTTPTDFEERVDAILSGSDIRFEREKIIIYANGTRFIIIDFFLPDTNYAIEIDGACHREQVKYDRQRDTYLASQGIKTIRFTNQQILKNQQEVQAELLALITQKKEIQ